jgi:N-carbamoylputrescine amidase
VVSGSRPPHGPARCQHSLLPHRHRLAPGREGSTAPPNSTRWRTIQRSHAIANGIYVAAVNRIGFEQGPHDSGLEFWGHSFLADPFGRVLTEASADREEILVDECDPKLQDEVRRNWPFLRDRRIDAYDGLTKRFLD